MNQKHTNLNKKKNLSSNFHLPKYAPGADAESAKICHFLHFFPIPISHQFAFFNDQKLTTKAEIDPIDKRPSTN